MKFKGIKKACGAMNPNGTGYSNYYIGVYYDILFDVVIYEEFAGSGSYLQFEEGCVVHVGDYRKRVTMAQLKEDIISRVEGWEALQEEKRRIRKEVSHFFQE